MDEITRYGVKKSSEKFSTSTHGEKMNENFFLFFSISFTKRVCSVERSFHLKEVQRVLNDQNCAARQSRRAGGQTGGLVSK